MIKKYREFNEFSIDSRLRLCKIISEEDIKNQFSRLEKVCGCDVRVASHHFGSIMDQYKRPGDIGDEYYYCASVGGIKKERAIEIEIELGSIKYRLESMYNVSVRLCPNNSNIPKDFMRFEPKDFDNSHLKIFVIIKEKHD